MGRSYDHIKKIADRLGWPTHYRRDLEYHDHRVLENYDGEFLWSIRDTGTHLQRRDHLCDEAKDKNGWRKFGSAWRSIASGGHSASERAFACDAHGCHEITGKPNRVTEIMERWMKDCAASPYRIREVLSGMRRRRRHGKQR